MSGLSACIDTALVTCGVADARPRGFANSCRRQRLCTRALAQVQMQAQTRAHAHAYMHSDFVHTLMRARSCTQAIIPFMRDEQSDIRRLVSSILKLVAVVIEGKLAIHTSGALEVRVVPRRDAQAGIACMPCCHLCRL